YAVLADGSVRFLPYNGGDTDDAFLRRVCQDARGTPPTRVELEYFVADPDPKKREKLVDLLLKDPAVAKKGGDGSQEKVLRQVFLMNWTIVPQVYSANPGLPLWDTAFVTWAQPDRFDTLIGQLLDAKRADDVVLDTVTAAVLGRLPTE